MNKIVVNGCYGGFGLSSEAVEWLADKYGLETEEFSGDKYLKENLEHDPRLVEVVETLGKKANGDFAELYVNEIQGNVYRIDEYDGSESVEVPDSIDWIVI